MLDMPESTRTDQVISEILKKAKVFQRRRTDEENRGQWGNQIQFILSAVGLAVGLANIWRFPAMAYENGGSAFLIPYICCGIVFGLPIVYAEFTIGQYARIGPGKAFRRYASGFQGIGWSMTFVTIVVTIYYCVILLGS